MSARLCAALLGAAVSVWAADPPAAPAPHVFPGESVELATKDGWKLQARFSPPQEGRLSLLLLHGTGGRKEDWLRLAKPLLKAGYGMLAIDLRGHGQSRTAPDGSPAIWRKFVVSKNYNEYLNMIADVEAGVAYLAAKGVPEEKVGLIGADLGSGLAIRYAALHPKVPFAVLLSPRLQYQDVTTVNALRAYKDRPVLMVYSDADRTTAGEIPILQRFASMSAGERKVTVVQAPTEHGTKMLRGALIGQILAWIEDPVKPEVATSSGQTPGEPAPPATPDEEPEPLPAPAQ